MTTLTVVMYHYVRDVEDSPFPGLRALGTEAFTTQVDRLRETHEIVTLDRALSFLAGEVVSAKPMCLLTFDDGLQEHAEFVTETLAARSLQGVFFLPTACVNEGWVIPAHKNHLLMAHLGFGVYRTSFLTLLKDCHPQVQTHVDPEAVAKTYRWDTAPVAAFKYLVNYGLEASMREALLTTLFEKTFGDERKFAAGFYLSWKDARRMQEAGMVLGSHTHRHPVLSSLSPEKQGSELARSMELIRGNARSQAHWPFGYPFGKRSTFDENTLALLERFGYHCAFSTEVREATPATGRYEIPRFDTKDV